MNGPGCLALVLMAILGITASVLITGVVIYAVWNLVVVPVFSMSELTYVQALLVGIALTTIGGMFKATVSTKS